MPPDQAGAVVKADAYGLGIAEVSNRLWQEGCRRFFVALAQEGVQLRQLLPSAQIYVLAGATAATINDLRDHGLLPVLNSIGQCALWADRSDEPAALHIDTGMHRLGLPSDLDYTKLPPLNLELVMTHFSRADDIGHAVTAEQYKRFQQCVETLQRLQGPFLISANNTAAVLSRLGPFDSVSRWVDRLGIGLYGVNPQHETAPSPDAQPLSTVATLEAEVLQVRSVDSGVSVGYGGTYQTAKPIRLATVSAGYADGVPRLLSNRGHVGFQGEELAIVGRISMDSLVVELPESSLLKAGDWVEIYGPNIPVHTVASQAQTISYEIFTRIGPRIQRVS
jgi:alanine racemase